tara:strand:- start:80 stop:496 length:417 start_codon:yes stop_codon:yes gene_type:complete
MRDRFDRGNGGGYAPVKVGDELEVTIEAVGAKGDGIAKKDGFVLFIPNAKEGDTVKVKVTRVLRKVGFAEVVGEGAAPAEGEEAAQDEYAEEQPADDAQGEEAEGSEEQSEDSEDFGEEEAPAEESEAEESDETEKQE